MEVITNSTVSVRGIPCHISKVTQTSSRAAWCGKVVEKDQECMINEIPPPTTFAYAIHINSHVTKPLRDPRRNWPTEESFFFLTSIFELLPALKLTIVMGGKAFCKNETVRKMHRSPQCVLHVKNNQLFVILNTFAHSYSGYMSWVLTLSRGPGSVKRRGICPSI